MLVQQNKDKESPIFLCDLDKRESPARDGLTLERCKIRSLLDLHLPFHPPAFLLLSRFSLLPSRLPLSPSSTRMFALRGSYPLYMAMGLKVRNWPVRYIAWVLSFCGAIEITIIWELPQSGYHKMVKLKDFHREWRLLLASFPVESISTKIAAIAIFVYTLFVRTILWAVMCPRFNFVRYIEARGDGFARKQDLNLNRYYRKPRKREYSY